MRKASRLFEIIQILRLARKPVTSADIAAQMEVSQRSVYRDIAALQAMRVPIEGGRGLGYILRPGFDLPPLMFSIEETEAIVLALALLDRTGDRELKQAAKRVNRKIAAAMTPSLRRTLDANALYAWGTISRPDGIDLALVIKANYADCHVILFSGHANTGMLLDEAERQGHRFEILAKPVEPQLMLERASSLFGRLDETAYN